ncbi:hypothetical protein TNCV_4941871 [Trichonephila clavipes]|nr:hypothetical protein TNCV_4941871 [Trichonephila clavipes]
MVMDVFVRSIGSGLSDSLKPLSHTHFSKQLESPENNHFKQPLRVKGCSLISLVEHGNEEKCLTEFFSGGRILEEIYGVFSSELSNLASIGDSRIFAFSQRSSSPRLIEDEVFNDSDNNLINYEDGQERFFESG